MKASSGTPVSVTLVRVRRPKALMDAGDASDGLAASLRSALNV